MPYLTCRNRHPLWSWPPTGWESCNQMKNLPLVQWNCMGLVSLLHPRPSGALAILCLQEALCPLSSLRCENSVSVAIAKIMAPRPLMPAQWKYGHNLFFCQAKGKRSGLAPQEVCPTFSGIGRGCTSSWRSCFFVFLLPIFKTAAAGSGNSAIGSGVPEVIGLWPSFWNAGCYKTV